jgi:hypothetical protein
VNLINNIGGGHCFGSSSAKRNTGGETTTYKQGNLVFDCGILWGMFPLYSCQNGVNFIRRLPLQEIKLDDNSHLDVGEIARRRTRFV